MADQRQTFRFRLPWLTAVTAPRPPQAPTQPPTFTTPAATRPPFRPAGLAPPPQAQASARTDSQPPSPSSATTQPRVTSQPWPALTASQPPSPSRAAAQSRAASQPPSPSRAAAQSRAASQPPSPLREATQSRAATQPPSPSRVATQAQAATQPPSPPRITQTQAAPKLSTTSSTASETQPSSQAAPQPQSPPKLTSQTAVQMSSLPSYPSPKTTQAQSIVGEVTQPLLSSKKIEPTTQEEPQTPLSSNESLMAVSQEEPPKPAMSQSKSEESQRKAEMTSEKVIDAQNQTSNRMPAQPSDASASVAAARPTSTMAVETSAPTQKSDSSLVSAEPRPLQESDDSPKHILQRRALVQGFRNIEIPKEPRQRTAASGSKAATKMHPSVAFDAAQKQQLTDSSSNGKQTKNIISHLRDKNIVSETRHKSAISNGEQIPLHKEIRDDISKFVHKMATQPPKHEVDDKPVSVITIAGENTGASMQLGAETAKREGAVHIRRGYKIDPDESVEATTDGEGSSKGRRQNDSNTEEDQASKAYINSNVQSINNSIVFSSSITERNPGVQLVLSHNLTEPVEPSKGNESLETHKAEFNVTPAQKLTYEPTVKRRCLRGLFMESSDSDPDNPEKPRRHGCRYACKKIKDNEIDVL